VTSCFSLDSSFHFAASLKIMAVALQCLSRAAGRQHALSGSPRVLGAITPKTPAFSPCAGGPAFFSPLPASTRSFGTGLMQATPASSPVDVAWFQSGGKSPAWYLRQAAASAAAQKEMAEAARPCAEAAHRFFLARGSLARDIPSATDKLPRLLGAQGPRTSSSLAARDAPALPVLLGRSTARQAPAACGLEAEFDPMAAAQEARQAFLARQRRIDSRGTVVSFEEDTLPVLLGRTAGSAAPMPPSDLAVGAAVAARKAFLARQQRIESRGIDQVVP